MRKDDTTPLKKITGALAAVAGAIVKWREENWDDLLGVAGLCMMWYGIQLIAPWVAWTVVGALVFIVSFAAKLIPFLGARLSQKGSGR